MSYGRDPDIPWSGIVVVAMIIAIIFFCAGIVGSNDPDKERSEEEVSLLQSDNDGDGYCAHEKSCAAEGVKIGDCDDTDPEIHPGVVEGPTGTDPFFGDGKDNDCDGTIDEGALDVDNDGDGYCAYQMRCLGEAKPGDCDDTNPQIHPGAPEVRVTSDAPAGLGQDNDCDGIIDNGTLFYDDDGDGFCEKECSDGVGKSGDCDDTDASIYPDAPEGERMEEGLLGDGKDNNCDGVIDEGSYNADHDGDGFCAFETCAGEAKPGDCDDQNPLVYQGAPEWLDGFDNDCEGLTQMLLIVL